MAISDVTPAALNPWLQQVVALDAHCKFIILFDDNMINIETLEIC